MNILPVLRMKNNKMTQREFAREVGVGLSTVINWEKDIDRMTVGKVKDVCKLFGVSPNELLEYKEESE